MASVPVEEVVADIERELPAISAVIFFTVAIFWVNHHHFFSRITHTDWKLFWANNLLLFLLAIVPFTTVPSTIPQAERRREWRRSWIGTTSYLAAAAAAFVWVPISLVVFAVIPLVFVVPNLLRGGTRPRPRLDPTVWPGWPG